MDPTHERLRRPTLWQALVLPEASFSATATQARHEGKLTSVELARRAKVPVAAVHRLEVGRPLGSEDLGAICSALGLPFPQLSRSAWLEFASLIWDRRRSAGLSRTKLARLAKLSAGTIKFIETARHPPSRASCLRLLEVNELGLTWADVAEVAGSPPKGVQTTATEAPDRVPPQPQPGVPASAPTIASERQPPTDGPHPPVPASRLAQTAPARVPADGPMLTIKIEVYADHSVQILCGPTALRA